MFTCGELFSQWNTLSGIVSLSLFVIYTHSYIYMIRFIIFCIHYKWITHVFSYAWIPGRDGQDITIVKVIP